MLLLSRCEFLLKTSSAVGEFAVYFNLKLHEHSLDLQFSSAVDTLSRPALAEQKQKEDTKS